jgi:hypothetical protein
MSRTDSQNPLLPGPSPLGFVLHGIELACVLILNEAISVG